MARWGAVWLALFSAGCLDATAERADRAVQFREPIRVVAVEGDTLEGIAEKYAVTKADLMAWNNLESDAVASGDMIFVWKVTEELLPDPTVFQEERTNAGVARRTIGGPQSAAPSPSPRRTLGGAPQHAGNAAPDSDPGGRPRSVRSSGIFGTDVGELGDDGLAEAAAGMQDSRGVDPRQRVRGASMRPGVAETSDDLDVRVKDLSSGPQIPNTAVRTPRMSRPAAKRCKTQRVKATDAEGMYGGDGLSSAQIKAALGRTLGTTRKCMPAGTKGSFSMVVELKVGCDGRVKNAYTTSRGGVPSRVTECIETVLSYTSFPAHDIPDGQSFQYPINYNF